VSLVTRFPSGFRKPDGNRTQIDDYKDFAPFYPMNITLYTHTCLQQGVMCEHRGKARASERTKPHPILCRTSWTDPTKPVTVG
jgi:hypothetical protein